jgi:hypothetical protein
MSRTNNTQLVSLDGKHSCLLLNLPVAKGAVVKPHCGGSSLIGDLPLEHQTFDGRKMRWPIWKLTQSVPFTKYRDGQWILEVKLWSLQYGGLSSDCCTRVISADNEALVQNEAGLGSFRRIIVICE